MTKSLTILILVSLVPPLSNSFAQSNFSPNPDSVTFHTEDIHTFWKVFDKTTPKFDPKVFQVEYIDVGSKGLKGFIKMRIEDGKNLSKTIKSNLTYYQAIRESSFLIDEKKERFYECFRNLKEIYSKAVFPDVYFVIGAKNTGGTTFNEGLIIGAEMYGKPTETFSPRIDIDYIDEVVAHELVHFQQNYAKNNTLLAQCIREGSADFICELIAGGHSNNKIHDYGNAHTKELWEEFLKAKDNTSWEPWLYASKDQSRPKDLGYWMGYKITQAYYNNMVDKGKAIDDILNVSDFNAFLEKSGYSGK